VEGRRHWQEERRLVAVVAGGGDPYCSATWKVAVVDNRERGGGDAEGAAGYKEDDAPQGRKSLQAGRVRAWRLGKVLAI